MNKIRKKLFEKFGNVLYSRKQGIYIVSTKQDGWPLGACTVMFQAGSRMEVDDELGATHFLRAATNTTGRWFTGFRKTRHVHELGGSLTVNSNRQTICYTLQCPVSAFDHLWGYLVDTAYDCFYYDWELDDKVRKMVLDDLKRIPPEQHVLDLVQKALFGGGLNNSVYCVKERIKTVNQEVLQNYADKYLSGTNASIGSVGLQCEHTRKVAEAIQTGDLERSIIKYVTPKVDPPRSLVRTAYEYYDYGPGKETWIAVGVQGCGAENLNEMLKYSILAASIGNGSLYRGSHQYVKIHQKPVGQYCSTDWFTTMKAFSISYMETGIFGLVVKTKSEYADQRATEAVAYLSHLKITPEEVEIGKRRLMMDYSRHDQNSAQLSEGMALMAWYQHKIETVYDACHAILCIPTADVVDEADKIAARYPKMALAVVGDVQAVHNLGMLWG